MKIESEMVDPPMQQTFGPMFFQPLLTTHLGGLKFYRRLLFAVIKSPLQARPALFCSWHAQL